VGKDWNWNGCERKRQSTVSRHSIGGTTQTSFETNGAAAEVQTGNLVEYKSARHVSVPAAQYDIIKGRNIKLEIKGRYWKGSDLKT
jgi:hypothetical protein